MIEKSWHRAVFTFLSQHLLTEHYRVPCLLFEHWESCNSESRVFSHYCFMHHFSINSLLVVFYTLLYTKYFITPCVPPKSVHTVYHSALMVFSQMCRLPILCVELHPVPSWVLAFKMYADYKSDAPTPLLPHGLKWTWFPKRIWSFDLSDDRGVFHFDSVHFKWAEDQRMWYIFKISTVCSFCCAGNDPWWSVFTATEFQRYSSALVFISQLRHHLFLTPITSEGQRTTDKQYWVLFLFLAYKDFSRSSEYINLTMYSKQWQSHCLQLHVRHYYQLLPGFPVRSLTEQWTPVHLYI